MPPFDYFFRRKNAIIWQVQTILWTMNRFWSRRSGVARAISKSRPRAHFHRFATLTDLDTYSRVGSAASSAGREGARLLFIEIDRSIYRIYFYLKKWVEMFYLVEMLSL